MTATPLITGLSVWSKLQLGIDNKDYHRHHHYHLQQVPSIGILASDKLHLYPIIVCLKSLIGIPDIQCQYGVQGVKIPTYS